MRFITFANRTKKEENEEIGSYMWNQLFSLYLRYYPLANRMLWKYGPWLKSAKKYNLRSWQNAEELRRHLLFVLQVGSQSGKSIFCPRNDTKDLTKLSIINTKIVKIICTNIVSLKRVKQNFENIASYCYLKSILKILNSATYDSVEFYTRLWFRKTCYWMESTGNNLLYNLEILVIFPLSRSS